MSKKGYIPIRLCIACRKKFSKYSLIRVVKNKYGEIFIDDSKKAPGRGTYVCYSKSCLNILKKKKILQKSFRCEVNKEIYLKIQCKI